MTKGRPPGPYGSYKTSPKKPRYRTREEAIQSGETRVCSMCKKELLLGANFNPCGVNTDCTLRFRSDCKKCHYLKKKRLNLDDPEVTKKVEEMIAKVMTPVWEQVMSKVEEDSMKQCIEILKKCLTV